MDKAFLCSKTLWTRIIFAPLRMPNVLTAIVPSTLSLGLRFKSFPMKPFLETPNKIGAIKLSSFKRFKTSIFSS